MEASTDKWYVFTVLTQEQVLVDFEEEVTMEQALELFKQEKCNEQSLDGESIVINIRRYEDAVPNVGEMN